MRNSEFWVMSKRSEAVLRGKLGFDYPGRNLPSVCIVELTPDELVYIWPKQPEYDSLCLVCEHQEQRSAEVCRPDSPSQYPCRFQSVPEAELSQDFDDFLYNGDYFVECGYFYSFQDFKYQNRYSDRHFFSYLLGSFSSIREARQMLKDTSKAAMDTF